MGSAKGYYLRANVWMPPTSGHSDAIRKKVFVEEIYHDHTFDLLTLSLHGPGYETELLQYDNNNIAGIVGEEVSVERQDRVRFHEGRILFMRANTDIHAQFPPSDISISLNIIPIDAKSLTRQQYRFDLLSNNRARITQVNYASMIYSQMALIDIAETIGDENTGEVLYDIARCHKSVGARSSALKVLHKKYSYRADELLNLSADDILLTKCIEQYMSE
ncbi:hypothetical protein AB835_10010 [Candidatus Endobugula sertula]|uniref:Uncharacterized protein n=1 Tax=Candidatus Endobugula sertula TaxID=62101 RepID=A0A1D2QNV0_9GAMM|nr:hypothetical protein AB835_10010 [Candidatus Endobugula sertula]